MHCRCRASIPSGVLSPPIAADSTRRTSLSYICCGMPELTFATGADAGVIAAVRLRSPIPTARSRAPVSVRIALVTVRAASRGISPSRRRRYWRRAAAGGSLALPAGVARARGAWCPATASRSRDTPELVSRLGDYRPPRAILVGEAFVVDRLRAAEMILHQPEPRRRLRAPRLIDAERR